MPRTASTPAVRPQISSLFMDFAAFFELSLALTPLQRRAVYTIRYNVYCEEFGYEDPSAFKDDLESDIFDDRSIHCLVTHKPSGMPAGCVRLVKVEAGSLMPMETHCGESLDFEFFRDFENRRDSMAEISRLAVDGQFRRRRGEKETRFGNTETLSFGERERRTFPLIAVSLFIAAAAVADLLRRKHAFAIMEPFLPSILRRTGIVVQRVGDDFDFRGLRAPYYLDIDESIRVAPEELRLCYEVVRSQFAEVLDTEADRKVSRYDESPLEHGGPHLGRFLTAAGL